MAKGLIDGTLRSAKVRSTGCFWVDLQLAMVRCTRPLWNFLDRAHVCVRVLSLSSFARVLLAPLALSRIEFAARKTRAYCHNICHCFQAFCCFKTKTLAKGHGGYPRWYAVRRTVLPALRRAPPAVRCGSTVHTAKQNKSNNVQSNLSSGKQKPPQDTAVATQAAASRPPRAGWPGWPPSARRSRIALRKSDGTAISLTTNCQVTQCGLAALCTVVHRRGWGPPYCEISTGKRPFCAEAGHGKRSKLSSLRRWSRNLWEKKPRPCQEQGAPFGLRRTVETTAQPACEPTREPTWAPGWTAVDRDRLASKCHMGFTARQAIAHRCFCLHAAAVGPDAAGRRRSGTQTASFHPAPRSLLTCHGSLHWPVGRRSP